MIDPRLSKSREGIRVGVKNFVRLEDQLPSAQMPPHVRIRNAPCRHGENTQSKNNHEHTTRLEALDHQSEDNTSTCVTRYKIASPFDLRLSRCCLKRCRHENY